MKYLLSSANSGDTISVITSCRAQLADLDFAHYPLIAPKDDVTSVL